MAEHTCSRQERNGGTWEMARKVVHCECLFSCLAFIHSPLFLFFGHGRSRYAGAAQLSHDSQARPEPRSNHSDSQSRRWHRDCTVMVRPGLGGGSPTPPSHTPAFETVPFGRFQRFASKSRRKWHRTHRLTKLRGARRCSPATSKTFLSSLTACAASTRVASSACTPSIASLMTTSLSPNMPCAAAFATLATARANEARTDNRSPVALHLARP